jgi:hypothetical protein
MRNEKLLFKKENMKTNLFKSIAICCFVLTVIGCGKDRRTKFSIFPLALLGGNTVSPNDSKGGVIQTSGGAVGSPAIGTGALPNNNPLPTNAGIPASSGTLPNNNPLTSNTGIPASPGTSASSGTSIYDTIVGYLSDGIFPLTVSPGSSLFRVKLFDAPVVLPKDNGLVNFITEFDFIESFFVNSNFTPQEIPPTDLIQLSIIKIETTNSLGTVITKIPGKKESSVVIKSGKHFVSFVRSLILPPDTYSYLKITLSSEAYLINGANRYKINLQTKDLTFANPFTVQAGMATTLHTVNYKEYNDKLTGNSREFVRRNFDVTQGIDFIYTDQSLLYSLQLELVPVSAEIHFPITALNVFVATLSALDSNNSAYILNDVPTIFEVLSLRNGFVGLAGSNQVDPKGYKLLQIQLGRLHALVVNGTLVQIPMDERFQNIFRFNGTFQMDSGNVYETYIHLDPEKSVFYTKEKGYVFDPYIELISTINVSPDVEAKISKSLNQLQNVVTSESELIIQGTVNSVTPVIAANAVGQNIIYSDITLGVQSVLKGNLTDSQFILRIPGGELNGIKLHVTSMPKFTNGENVVLFLKQFGSKWKIVRGHFGKVSL